MRLPCLATAFIEEDHRGDPRDIQFSCPVRRIGSSTHGGDQRRTLIRPVEMGGLEASDLLANRWISQDM